MQGHVPKTPPGWSGLESILITVCAADPCPGTARSKGREGGRRSGSEKMNGEEPRPKNASSVCPWLSHCPRTRLSVGACPRRCWAPPARGLRAQDPSPRENPIQSIFGGSELSFPFLPCEKKQTPASHPCYCSWKDGFSSRKQALICINAG